MNASKLLEIARNIKVPGHEIEPWAEKGMLFLRVKFVDPYMQPREWYGRLWHIHEHLCELEVIEIAFDAILESLKDRLKRKFAFRGKALFDQGSAEHLLADAPDAPVREESDSEET